MVVPLIYIRNYNYLAELLDIVMSTFPTFQY